MNSVHAEQQRTILSKLEQFSDWMRPVSVVKKFLSKVKGISQHILRQQSELAILKMLQPDVFSVEMTLL